MLMRYCILIFSALLLVTSCTKVENEKSRQEILRDGSWRLDAASIEYKLHSFGPMLLEVNRKVNLFDDINKIVYWRSPDLQDSLFFDHKRIDPECRADDQLKFRENHDGAHIPGEVTCSINETAELEFRWGLIGDETQMYIYDAKEFFRTDVNADIIEFYNDKFGIVYSEYIDKRVSDGTNPAYFVTDTLTYTMYFRKIGGGEAE